MEGHRILHVSTEYLTVLRTDYQLAVTTDQYVEWVNLEDNGERVQYVIENALIVDTEDLGLAPGYSEDDDRITCWADNPCEGWGELSDHKVRYVGLDAAVTLHDDAARIALAAVDLRTNVLESAGPAGAWVRLNHWNISFHVADLDYYQARYNGGEWSVAFGPHARNINIEYVGKVD